jgi:hypothetical protein
MSRKFKSLLNLTTLATDPIGSVGDVFFNTTDKALKIHNGTTWVILSQNTDPTPFYLHTHTYDGDVHTIDVSNPITFKEINNENPATVQEEIPAIIGMDGGSPNSLNNNPSFVNLTLLDGGEVGN